MSDKEIVIVIGIGIAVALILFALIMNARSRQKLLDAEIEADLKRHYALIDYLCNPKKEENEVESEESDAESSEQDSL